MATSAPRTSREPDLEATSCPICELAPPSAGGYDFPPHRVVHCPGCTMWYLTPRLTEAKMLDFYRHEDYFEGAGVGYSSYLAQERTLRRTFGHLLGELARRGLTGGRLLEIGCAYGFFLDEARGFFDERIGSDFSASAAERARPLADAVVVGGIEDLPDDEPFDAVVVIHTIEHVYRPRELVASIRHRLRPGGTLLLAAPNMSGFWRPLLGRRWPFFKIPEHVSFFDHRTLSILLEESGFVDVEPIPYRSVFSLSLIAEKLGIERLPLLGKLTLPLPAITAAVIGRAP